MAVAYKWFITSLSFITISLGIETHSLKFQDFFFLIKLKTKINAT